MRLHEDHYRDGAIAELPHPLGLLLNAVSHRHAPPSTGHKCAYSNSVQCDIEMPKLGTNLWIHRRQCQE